MIKVGVLGANGRMGSLVCQTVHAADDLDLAAAVDEGDQLDALTSCDVLVDFTHPAAVVGNLHWCVEHGLNVAVGTSGFDAARLAQVAGWLQAAPGVQDLAEDGLGLSPPALVRQRHPQLVAGPQGVGVVLAQHPAPDLEDLAEG